MGGNSLVGFGPLVAVLGDERIKFLGSSRAVRVGHRPGSGAVPTVDPVEYWGEDLKITRLSPQNHNPQHKKDNEATSYLPRNIEFIITHKVRVVATESVEDERLVRLWDLGVHEAALVREVHLCRDRTRLQAGGLSVELEVHRFGRLDPDDKLVPRDVLEDTLRHILELDPDLDLGFVQCCYDWIMRSIQGIVAEAEQREIKEGQGCNQ